jgi:hypothetical protein
MGAGSLAKFSLFLLCFYFVFFLFWNLNLNLNLFMSLTWVKCTHSNPGTEIIYFIILIFILIIFSFSSSPFNSKIFLFYFKVPTSNSIQIQTPFLNFKFPSVKVNTSVIITSTLYHIIIYLFFSLSFIYQRNKWFHKLFSFSFSILYFHL